MADVWLGHPSYWEHLQFSAQICSELEYSRLPKHCWNNDEVSGTFHGPGRWRLKDPSLVLKQRLPKIPFPWPSAHRGLAELLSLMFSRSGLWGTSPCCRGFPFSGLAVLRVVLCMCGALGSSAAGVPAGREGCSASHLGCRGVQLSSANRNDLKYRFPSAQLSGECYSFTVAFWHC